MDEIDLTKTGITNTPGFVEQSEPSYITLDLNKPISPIIGIIKIPLTVENITKMAIILCEANGKKPYEEFGGFNSILNRRLNNIDSMTQIASNVIALYNAEIIKLPTSIFNRMLK